MCASFKQWCLPELWKFQSTRADAEKAFELEPYPYKMSIWLLAAAQTGDIQQFYTVSDRCRAIIPDEYERVKLHLEAVEAYALAKSKHLDRAQELIVKWKEVNDTAFRVNRYWGQLPGGSDVVKNWKELVGASD